MRDDENINIFNKLLSHWHSGNRRYTQSSILSSFQTKYIASINITSLLQDNQFINNALSKGTAMHQKLFHKYYFSKFTNMNSVKNFCLFLGKNSTYNRQLNISRQTMRKLAKTGLIIGLQKK